MDEKEGIKPWQNALETAAGGVDALRNSGGIVLEYLQKPLLLPAGRGKGVHDWAASWLEAERGGVGACHEVGVFELSRGRCGVCQNCKREADQDVSARCGPRPAAHDKEQHQQDLLHVLLDLDGYPEGSPERAYGVARKTSIGQPHLEYYEQQLLSARPAAGKKIKDAAPAMVRSPLAALGLGLRREQPPPGEALSGDLAPPEAVAPLRRGEFRISRVQPCRPTRPLGEGNGSKRIRTLTSAPLSSPGKLDAAFCANNSRQQVPIPHVRSQNQSASLSLSKTRQPPPEEINKSTAQSAGNMPYFDSTSNGLTHLTMLDSAVARSAGESSRRQSKRESDPDSVAEWVRGLRQGLGVRCSEMPKAAWDSVLTFTHPTAEPGPRRRPSPERIPREKDPLHPAARLRANALPPH